MKSIKDGGGGEMLYAASEHFVLKANVLEAEKWLGV